MSEKSQKIRIACDLPKRQREVLRLIAEGYTSKAIGITLDSSPKTIEYHRAELMKRIGLGDVAHMTKLALRLGLTEIDV